MASVGRTRESLRGDGRTGKRRRQAAPQAQPTKAATLGRRGYAHGLAILGDGAARDLDALALQQVDDAIVGQWRAGALGTD